MDPVASAPAHAWEDTALPEKVACWFHLCDITLAQAFSSPTQALGIK